MSRGCLSQAITSSWRSRGLQRHQHCHYSQRALWGVNDGGSTIGPTIRSKACCHNDHLTSPTGNLPPLRSVVLYIARYLIFVPKYLYCSSKRTIASDKCLDKSVLIPSIGAFLLSQRT